MSNHWDIRCLSCNEDLGFEWNHASEEYAEVLKYRDELTACADLLAKPNLWRVNDGGALAQIANFLGKHRGHDLVPRDEYGRLLGQCPERTPAYENCVLAKGHGGEHFAPAKAIAADYPALQTQP